LSSQSEEARSVYRTRLTASIDYFRLLLHQGLNFHGHDESKESLNQSNFTKLLKFVTEHNEDSISCAE